MIEKGKILRLLLEQCIVQVQKLFLTEPDGMTVYKMKKSNPIMFKAGSTIGGIVLKKRLLISHAMTREELVIALADYIE
jgi:hypothetical protein